MFYESLKYSKIINNILLARKEIVTTSKAEDLLYILFLTYMYIVIADIPLTPKELSLLMGEPGTENSGVRASHSSESILDAPDSPPPKPARPNQ